MNEQSVWLTETQTVINAGNFRLGIIPGESFLTSHVSCVFISDELHTYWIVFLIFNVSSVVFRLPVIFLRYNSVSVRFKYNIFYIFSHLSHPEKK